MDDEFEWVLTNKDTQELLGEGKVKGVNYPRALEEAMRSLSPAQREGVKNETMTLVLTGWSD